MIRLATSIIAMTFLLSGTALAQEAHLMRYADVHGDQIVFTYEDDLWLASTAGGEARRITRHAGIERNAKFSPDGTRIAFTAEYDGGRDVYVMDLAGGAPVRLTFHPAHDRVVDWHPDGQHVLFRSKRVHPYRTEKAYLVPVQGGMPSALPIPRAGLASFSPDGTWLAYNRLSREERTWKRHKGGTAQDIWLSNLATGEFYQITQWEGTDNFPMWHADKVYFNSDQLFETLNVMEYDARTGAVRPMTQYADYDVKYPSFGPGAIVFQYAESLHLLDLASGEVKQIPVSIPSDAVHMRASFEKIANHIDTFSLSPTGKRLLVGARGEIVDLPLEEGQAVDLTHDSASREKNAAWSPDGRHVAFISDRTGEEEVYLLQTRGDGSWRQVSQGGLGYRMHLVWSPNSDYLLFSDKFMRLNLLDVASGQLSVIDQGTFDDAWQRWGIQDYVWSPCGRWVAYSKMEPNMNESIFLFSLDAGRVARITDDATTDWSPSFDPQGAYLYFLSNRTYEPIMGFVDQNHVFLDVTRPYLVILRDGEASPFAAEDPEDLGIPAEEDEEDEDKDKRKDAIQIDLPGIERRVVAVPGIDAGTHFRLEATDDGFLYLSRPEPQFLKYQIVTDETDGGLDLRLYDLEEEEASLVATDVGNYHLAADLSSVVLRKGKRLSVVDVEADADVDEGKVCLGKVRIQVDRRAEFLQIFDEAWRVQRDWFYDPGMHQVDWAGMREKYRGFVPFCGNRGDLNYLIGEMIGELNIGHSYVWGGDHPDGPEHVSVGLLGADFDTPADSPFHRIAHVVPGVSWNPDEYSPLTSPGCGAKDGDYLIAIDGAVVSSSDNVYAHLQDKRGRLVTVAYSSQPSMDSVATCQVETIDDERSIRYREWVEGRRAYVAAASAGEIGYVHIPSMGQSGLAEFARSWYSQIGAQAMIIDVRYNGGGFVADMIIDRLERQVWSMTQAREGVAGTNPEKSFRGPLVVLISQDSGSNAEFFAEAIKRMNLGTVIGTRTWGGSIGIELHQDLVDGGITTPPQFGLFGLDRTWLIEGRGVEPHIEVWNLPGDVLAGKDTQLDAAIENLKQQMPTGPNFPPPPEYPDKSKKIQ